MSLSREEEEEEEGRHKPDKATWELHDACASNHMDIVKQLLSSNSELISTNSSNSAVAEHAISSGHTIAWDEASVIDSNPHLHPQCALEAWHIWSQPHPLNRERGNLSPAYDRLIARTAPDTGSAC